MHTPFNTSFAKKDDVRRARHGFIWSKAEYDTLNQLFYDGCTLEQMCCTMERPADGIISKLLQERHILFNAGNSQYYVRDSRVRANPKPQPQENDMSDNTVKVVETKTFVDGIDASTLSDQDIFNRIAKREDMIEKFNKIKNKPIKLTTLINQIQSDIEALMAFVDARPSV